MARQYTDRLQRPEWHRWYSTARWQHLRILHLSKQPLCVFCAESGFTIAANVVDHKIPPRGDYTLFWDPKNLQSLCLPHHNSSKQQIEKGNKGYVREIGIDGFPVDVNHPFNQLERKQQKYAAAPKKKRPGGVGLFS
jgi:5-methylcytosine-specific restriction protein A